VRCLAAAVQITECNMNVAFTECSIQYFKRKESLTTTSCKPPTGQKCIALYTERPAMHTPKVRKPRARDMVAPHLFILSRRDYILSGQFVSCLDRIIICPDNIFNILSGQIEHFSQQFHLVQTE